MVYHAPVIAESLSLKGLQLMQPPFIPAAQLLWMLYLIFRYRQHAMRAYFCEGTSQH